MRLGCRALRILRVFGLGTVFAIGAGGAMSVAAEPPAQVPTHGPGWCPVTVNVDPLSQEHRVYALHLESSETGKASGTIALYAGDQRYDIPFESVVVTDWADDETVPTPLVVRFPASIDLDGAYVRFLAAPLAERCDAPFLPWLPRTAKMRASPQPPKSTAEYMRRALAAEPQEAPSAIADPRTCSTPDRRASTIAAVPPAYPAAAAKLGITATVYVRVILNADDSIHSVAIINSSTRDDLDQSALAAASSSRFRGATFRCKPAIGVYAIGMIFGP
jgi:TonB family protein